MAKSNGKLAYDIPMELTIDNGGKDTGLIQRWIQKSFAKGAFSYLRHDSLKKKSQFCDDDVVFLDYKQCLNFQKSAFFAHNANKCAEKREFLNRIKGLDAETRESYEKLAAACKILAKESGFSSDDVRKMMIETFKIPENLVNGFMIDTDVDDDAENTQDSEVLETVAE